MLAPSALDRCGDPEDLVRRAMRDAFVSPSRSDPAFDLTRELLAEEEVLSGQLRTGPDHEPQQAQQASEEGDRRSEHVG